MSLLHHFQSKGMTEELLNQIVGPGSMLAQIVSNVRQQIFLNPEYGWCPEWTEQ